MLAERTERLDRFLADQLGLSRTAAARLVAEGAAQVNEAAARASLLLQRGDRVQVAPFASVRPGMRPLAPCAMALTIVYEDEHLAVVDKPAGLVVHPAPGHWGDTLVNALVARGTTLSGGPDGRPGIVHRLDRDTSGLLVVAKSDLAHRRLAHAIAARRVHRTYAALAWGHLDQDPTLIEAPIARSVTDRKRMAVRPEGRPARTEARTVARFGVADLLRVVLVTGRTHQIRVHLAHIGHPVVGDPVYHGGGSRRVSGSERTEAERLERCTPRQALHAAELRFRHPIHGEPLALRSEWPPDLMPALRAVAGNRVHIADREALRYLRFFGEASE